MNQRREGIGAEMRTPTTTETMNENTHTRPTAWIFDVDGTLANVDSILHHLVNGEQDFEAFHRASIDVEPHHEVVEMARTAAKAGHSILVVTARQEFWRAATSFWIAMHNIPSDALFMRSNRDYRPDYEVKREVLNHILQLWDVVHAVDDNPNVIKLWEQSGIPTTKIGDWDGN